MGAVLGLCSFNITVAAAGTQQTEEYVSVDLTAYFDPSNIINTVIPIPVADDMWFDEATNKLYTFGSTDWDAGVDTPTAQPGSPVTGDKWFDEAANTLYTYETEAWDAGVELPVANPSLTYGQTLSFASDVGTMENHTFLYWEINNSINYLPVDHQFSLQDTNVLKAVFSPSDKHVVTFVDSNSKILKIEYVVDDGTATAPETLPTKLGYTVAETNWDVTLTNITEDTIAVLQYTKTDTTSYTLSVPNGSGDGSYEYNTVATVVADAPTEGEYFHHWEVEDHTVSYQSTYKFTVLENTTITAVYSTSAVTDAPTVTITDSFSIRGGYKTFIGQFYLPSSYTMVEYGILASPNEEWVELDTATAVRYQSSKFNGTTGEYVMSFVNANAVSTRAYLICKDSEDALVTVYSEPSYQILNGGFETDTLAGWTAYMIWKNESGMAAYQDARVIDNTYFGSNTYGRDGSYNLGIVWDGASWDQSSERMGHLRSSNFVLGGSGWISFKIGGGKISSTAFVSVRRASDNVEVARFANKNYNNTTIATAQYGSSISNAEAFMFQYYYDLSSVGELGEIYYIVLTESAAYDWCIMSADSFITYYKEDQSPIADQTATNIVPSILGVDTATNSIVNGYFDDGLNNWQNVNSSFYINSGQARSNPAGDSNLGVLRSSAFTINGTGQYLRFDWAGGLKYDKQIYISVKEVGTNIEVLRFVRRDNLSTKESESFDNHMLNLSSLDTAKKYYLEICDNRSGSWGISYVDAIRLVDLATWNSVTTGDRAVSVTPLETDFTYVKP